MYSHWMTPTSAFMKLLSLKSEFDLQIIFSTNHSRLSLLFLLYVFAFQSLYKKQ